MRDEIIETINQIGLDKGKILAERIKTQKYRYREKTLRNNFGFVGGFGGFGEWRRR